jgi:hypothetical protein
LLRLLQARGLRGEVGGDVQQGAINAASVTGRSRANIAASRRAPCADVPLVQALAIALNRSAEAERRVCAPVKGSNAGIVEEEEFTQTQCQKVAGGG